MKEVVADTRLVALCGLFCGACKRYLRGGCPGCVENLKATWCKIRTCCLDAKYSSCAECRDFADPADCKKFDNLFSRVIGFLLRSDRRACIMQVKECGLQTHAERMAAKRQVKLRPS